MRTRHIRLAFLAVGLALAAPTSVEAEATPPGIDLFETNPTTQLDFSKMPIAPGFFAPGSAAFTGVVRFGGEPFNSLNGKDTGDADTAVQRLGASDPMGITPTPIQLIKLNLVAVEPIMVTVGGATQAWDVHASVGTMPSTGSILIHPSGPKAGTYDSDFTVLPLLTFTRLSDGAIKTLDTSTLPLTPEARSAMMLQERGAPYHAGGCVAPALAVAGVNDGFCPGETAEDRKMLTYEESQALAHGILPVQPRLEHFKCYDVITPRFRSSVVDLADQFGRTRARVGAPINLCNPAQKNAEPFRNKSAHLTCYAIRDVRGRFQPRTVPIRNQFGSFTVRVRRPESLCVPSVKQLLPARGKPKPLGPEEMIDHFQCYAASSPRPAGAVVALRDQFHLEPRVRVRELQQLCAPVSKNGEPILHPVRHLACYRIKGPPVRRRVRVGNQFGSLKLIARAPRRLCVPSIKGEPDVQPPPFTQLPPLTQPPLTQPPITQPPVTQPPPLSGTGTFFNAVGPGVEFTVSFNQATTQFDIVLSGSRQVAGPGVSPPGFTCIPATTSTAQDTFRCSGNLPANTPAQGRVQTEPFPSAGMGGQLYGYQGSTKMGPFAIAGP